MIVELPFFIHLLEHNIETGILISEVFKANQD